MLLPGESIEELNRAETAWSLLKPWGISADNSTLERHADYTFQACWCQRWRCGPLLVAGDSAHLMPPFAGQGMCSGLRDAANLAWKLDLVLAGSAPDALLDTYGPERAEHVRHFIAASMELGEVICKTDPAEAAERDEMMRADLARGKQIPPRPLPRLGPGLHRGESADDAGGILSIQAPVTGPEGTALLDDVVGNTGQLLLDHTAGGAVTDERRRALQRLGIATIVLAPEPAPGHVVDIQGAYAAWMHELGSCAVLIRPDFYVFGTARTLTEAAQLVDDFLAAVSAAPRGAGDVPGDL
jgi:3-(3-hydroxy-phenyl)propionate hydroxylase